MQRMIDYCRELGLDVQTHGGAAWAAYEARDDASAPPRWRFALGRTWDPAAPCMAFALLNPSTANHEQDDPTTRRLRHFATTHGAGSYVLANAHPLRASSPRVLDRYLRYAKTEQETAAEDLNRKILHFISAFTPVEVNFVVAGWGASATKARKRVTGQATVDLLRTRDLWCLGTNKDRSPKHPLYLPNTAILSPWPPLD